MLTQNKKVYVVKGFGHGDDSFSTAPLENAEVYEGNFTVERKRVNVPSRGVLTSLICEGKIIAQNFKKQ